MIAMRTRVILKNLTCTAAAAFVLVSTLTLILRILTLLAALATDLGERLVTAGDVARAAVVEAGTLPTPPMPTGYRTRDMAATGVAR